MKLDKKKALAARIFNVSKSRILFIEPRLDEIKEAITKEDIRNLRADGAIIIKPIKAKRAMKRRKAKKGAGNIKKHAKNKKKEYIILTRKLRNHIQELKNKNLITKKQIFDIRKKIRNRYFKSKFQLKEYLSTLKK